MASLEKGIGARWKPVAHRDGLEPAIATAYPGTIKAFHYHVCQTDIWAPVEGMLQVGLYDLRVGSPTFGMKNTLSVQDIPQ